MAAGSDALPVHSQMTESDRHELARLQDYVASWRGSYVYLEIGSYLGGSLAPHLVDPRCELAYSIDKRVSVQPDPRKASGWKYTGNTTEAMLERLSGVPGANLDKLRTFDLDASDVPISVLPSQPDMVLIDAEHTDKAVMSDWRWCRKIAADRHVVAFHDAELVSGALRAIQVIWGMSRSSVATVCRCPSIAAFEVNSRPGGVWSAVRGGV